VNPALAAATLVAVVLVIAAATRVSAEAGHLKVAKQEAFDSILALTQARAVSYDANADESRYLVDPARAAQYQQAFLTESQQLADVGNVGIFSYDAALAAGIRAYDGDNSDVRFGGYLGAEFGNITFAGERAAAIRTLLAYQVYERDDRKLRALAQTDLAAAVGYDVGTAAGQSDWAFNQYDEALSSVIAINSAAFTDAIQAGQGDAAAWNLAFPVVGAALLAALVLAGVRPRLAEYH
jgi:Tfp pilus assembly protein PilP